MKLRPKQTTPWPADHVEQRLVEDLIPSASNSRNRTDAVVGVIERSIGHFGFTNPVLIDENNIIIAGHGRVLAAKRAGITTIPVTVARGWSEEDKRAYGISDNQIAALATWDMELLRTELAFLDGSDFDVSLTGFEDKVLKNMMTPIFHREHGGFEPHLLPSLPAVTRSGDSFSAGPNLIVCGDSTKKAVVSAAMTRFKPVLMVTDPSCRAAGRSNRKVSEGPTGLHDALAPFSGDVVYIWQSGRFPRLLADSLAALEFDLRAQIIWVKNHIVPGRADYHWRHETCFYAVRKGAKSHWASDGKQDTVWDISGDSAVDQPENHTKRGHNRQKPVERMRRPMEHNSAPGDAVYDPFLAVGDSLIAAEMTGRACLGIESNPRGVDLSIRRWQALTGEEAVHEATGKTFAALARDRAAKSTGRSSKVGLRRRSSTGDDDVA